MYWISKKDNFKFFKLTIKRLESLSYNTLVCTRSSTDIYNKFKVANKLFSQDFFHIISTTKFPKVNLYNILEKPLENLLLHVSIFKTSPFQSDDLRSQ